MLSFGADNALSSWDLKQLRRLGECSVFIEHMDQVQRHADTRDTGTVMETISKESKNTKNSS